MLRSLFTSIGGLRNHQVMLDTTANNIANVNTVGFKAQRVAFEDMMSQTLRGASAPGGSGGGSGPTQVGLGMQLGGISSVLTQGSSQTTGQWSDLAIQGDGHFIVASAADAGGTVTLTDFAFTRAGNFTLDKDGYLVMPAGKYVAGQAAVLAPPAAPTFATELSRIRIPADAQSVSIGRDGTVTYVAGSDDPGGSYQKGDAVPLSRVACAKFPNPNGLDRVGGNLLRGTPNSGTFNPGATDQSTEAVKWGAAAAWGGSIMGGTLEMSNVDLAGEFTQMITAQRGFQANSRVITTSDSMLEELVNLKR
ncbi:MAG: Flagellar hook protein FlgE [uncultured Thermoleophilia bacterium]|uniref:Flagellar hook protein FlgE n=1 Tax=uncultured Thermoleophilia bacterium TaxID=1497501 RepID=A0A6J4UB54_9ACTN|nr:MAG: Flagellar hook protein FlgE [uncultured Thermoleophilia bacterium]